MLNVKDYKCPICKSDQYNLLKKFSDGVLVGQCKSCSLIYTPERHNNPEDLFGEFPIERLEIIYKPIIDGRKQHFRSRIFKKYLSLIDKYSSGTKHLDIGCAHGFFMNITNKNGYVTTGIEPNTTMAKFGRKLLNLEIYDGTFKSAKIKDKSWDVISFTDSLEYFLEPIEDLNTLAANHLNKNGIIFIKVPNGDYFKLRNMLSKFKISLGGAESFSPSKRVVHYNYDTINFLSEKIGLDTLKRGFIEPIDSPVWTKLTGIHLETEAPWWIGVKEKLTRKFLHYIGLIEFFILRKNHFSQSVFIIIKKN